jgi:chromate transport protein ChrA
MPENLSNKDYEELGRMLVHIYETGYPDRKKLLKYSFLKGMVTGLGGVLGATILITALIWALSLFERIPLIGPFFDKVQTTVDTKS